MNEDFIKTVSDSLEDVYFLEGALDGKYPFSHSLLIKNILIDTGISTKYLRKLKKEKEIDKIILSHWHEDHISGNRIFPNKDFFCHRSDKHIVENISKMIEHYDVLGSGFEEEFRDLLKLLRMENVKVSNLLEDNQVIPINNLYNLKVIHTPGHTSGHCCFYEPEFKYGFLADIDLSSFPFYGGIDSNLVEFEKSIAKIQNYDFDIVITGHKGIIQGKKKISEKIRNFKNIIKKRDQRILENFKEREITQIKKLVNMNLIYKKYSKFKDYELIAERIMIENHIDKFLQKGLIEKTDDGYILR